MAVQNCIGDGIRGATWVALHNGGGVGWGEVTNGGFGLVLDGSQECDAIVGSMLTWDVYNGVTRRAWSGNENAFDTISRAVCETPGLCVTLPNRIIDEAIFDGLI